MRIELIQLPGETVWHVHVDGKHATDLCGGTFSATMQRVKKFVSDEEKKHRSHLREIRSR